MRRAGLVTSGISALVVALLSLKPHQLPVLAGSAPQPPAASSAPPTPTGGTHIFHPHHGTPVTPFASLTVIGPRLTMTDAYATAAFARGDGARDWLETLDGYEGLAVLPDGEEWRTPGFSQY
ncbi:FAD:protein FMN transferase [Streptomyces laculatispora]|uniref:FAD:protein FMN transferase n=1 Tax=Streptomyces laculatispora TaxID=887464 RepID=A0ABY9HZY2_9ACTN|nr:FAD:protein FMN transferase [Streptomyces laculatispora]WLQ39629.1 FAD:protein FMN transferase [Streptomyces laculatispora]